MASLDVNAAALDGLITSVTRQIADTWKRLGEAGEETAQFGAKTAQSYTATRPGATTGKTGRVETGEMIKAIRPQTVAFSPDLIQARYGFVDDLETYFIAQTVTGFTHNRSGDFIAPTFALRDSIGPTNEFARNAARGAI